MKYLSLIIIVAACFSSCRVEPKPEPEPKKERFYLKVGDAFGLSLKEIKAGPFDKEGGFVQITTVVDRQIVDSERWYRISVWTLRANGETRSYERWINNDEAQMIIKFHDQIKEGVNLPESHE